MGNLIDGRAIAGKVYVDLRTQIAELKSKGVTPGLAVVLIGDNPASRTYVRSKDKMSRELSLHSVKLELPASTTQSELLERVEAFNRDPTWMGFIRSMWRSSRWATQPVSFRARRLECNGS